MRFSLCRWSIGCLILLLTVLFPDVAAIEVPSSLWSSLRWPDVLNSQEVQQYADALIRDAAIASSAVAEQLDHFKNTIENLVSVTVDLRAEVQNATASYGLTIDNFSDMLSTELDRVLEELQDKFPPPNKANHHEERVEIILMVLLKVEESLVRVAGQCGIEEAVTRAHFQNIKPLVQDVLVVAGDLREQHPILLETILVSGMLPEAWFLRPVLRIFGFGPPGLIKAAWVQSRFWGARVAESSWFSHLQRAGMKSGIGSKIIESIGAGTSLAAALFSGTG